MGWHAHARISKCLVHACAWWSCRQKKKLAQLAQLAQFAQLARPAQLAHTQFALTANATAALACSVYFAHTPACMHACYASIENAC